jgi:hypothetical protein
VKNSDQEKRYNRWLSLIEEQEKSGLTQKQFCEQHKLVLSQFVYYRLELKKKEKAPALKPPNFAPVQIQENKNNTATNIRVLLPNGMQCVLPSHMDVRQVKQWVEVLLSC